MAKKSSKKSMKFVLLDLLTLLLGGALIGFLALPYIKYQASGFGSTLEQTASGFNLLDFDGNAGIATIVLLLIIFASLTILFALLKACVDGKIINDKSFSKIAKFGLIVSAIACFIITIVAMIVIASECSSGSLGIFGIGAGSKPAWLSLITSALIGLGALVSSLLSVKK